MDRRKFLKQSATAAAGATLVGAATSRSSAGQSPSPNEIINVGIIGCGGMGSTHRRKLVRMSKNKEPVRVVAVCDVWKKRLDEAVKDSGAKPYEDYRRLLEDKDVDVVCIATPHHWHAKMTIEAAEAGKDIYCEKPMTHWRDLDDAKRVVEAVARNRRVMQVGTNGMSDSIWEQAAERIKAGDLGTLIHAQASDMRNHYIAVFDPTRSDPEAKPGVNLDWEMWQGPARKHPWYPGRFFAFRVYWDYAGGIASDFFPHLLTPLVSIMGLKFPKRVVSSGGLYYHRDGREVPDIINISIEYPDGPSLLLLGSVANDTNLKMQVRGTKATMTLREGPGIIIEPQRYVNKEGKREEIKRYRGESVEEHWRDLLECVRTRGKPRSNEVLGYYVMAALHMGIHSYLKGRAMEFDPKTEKAYFL